ncbi:MAG: chemotaxis protein [Lachnospiraceae bacterium]|nr:chemotaxis protein [Lachnospiraceae bacterium]
MASNILLESGTNECEILEFIVGGNHYGINVAKVREILKFPELTPIPMCHPNIEGAFSKRGETVSVINLARALGMTERDASDTNKGRLLMTSFNNFNAGFHIDEVIGIRRVNWANIIKPDSMIISSSAGLINGIVTIDERLVLMLDFEGILAEIVPEFTTNVTEQLKMLKDTEPKTTPIFYAEDSRLIRENIKSFLIQAGFTNITAFSNGLELYNQLLVFKKEKSVKENVGVVITDLEMPQMDGHRLLKLIKDDKDLKDIPVIIFSSLIDDQMEIKGQELDATAQYVKSNPLGLIETIRGLEGSK